MMTSDKMRLRGQSPSPVSRDPFHILCAEKFRVVAPMLIYMAAYLLSFAIIEHWDRMQYTIIHSTVDNWIPFVPAFVIPYLLWFPYVAGFALFLLLKNEAAYHRFCTCLVIGMTVFIIVSVVYPNIHQLRPKVMPYDNIFTRAIRQLYQIDTPTNLTPSIHVFNSLAVVCEAWEWNWRDDNGQVYSTRIRRTARAGITILGILIILSTMFIKQHSFSDVTDAAALFAVTYFLVYRRGFLFSTGNHTKPVLRSARTDF